MEPENRNSTNFSIFIIIWIGQILSIFGSAVAEFGITLWAYEATGKATPLTLIGVFYTIPMLALSPVVGVMVDRYNRKLMMMLSDFSAALVSVIILSSIVDRQPADLAFVCHCGDCRNLPGFPLAGLFCRHQHHAAQAALRPRQCHAGNGWTCLWHFCTHGCRRIDWFHRSARSVDFGSGRLPALPF